MVQHKFTFPTREDARNYVHRLCLAIQQQDLEFVPIFIDEYTVYILDAHHQHERIIQLAKSSSATNMKAIRLPYPSEPPT